MHLAEGVALTLALLLTLFLIQAASHLHANGQDEANCNRCQMAHHGFGLATSYLVLPTPLGAADRVCSLVLTSYRNLFANYSSSRAPPSA